MGDGTIQLLFVWPKVHGLKRSSRPALHNEKALLQQIV